MTYPVIQHVRGTAEQWALVNPILASGEFGIELDTNKFKIGDGSTNWSNLPYGAGGASDYTELDNIPLLVNSEANTVYMNGSNVGEYSNDILFGVGSAVTGNGTVVMGHNTISGSNSIAIGHNTNVSGTSNTYIIGHGIQSPGASYSVFITDTAQNGGTFGAVAIGMNTHAGSGTVAVGNNTVAAFTSVAVGNNAQANGSYSVAIGNSAFVSSGSYSVAIGDRVNAYQTKTVAIGQGISANSGQSVLIGTSYNTIENNSSYSIAISGNVGENSTSSIAIGGNVSDDSMCSIVIGNSSDVDGNYSVALGTYIKAHTNQVVLGKFGVEDTNSQYAFIFADGNDSDSRKNVATIGHNGEAYFDGKVSISSNVVSFADNDLVTKKYVDEHSGSGGGGGSSISSDLLYSSTDVVYVNATGLGMSNSTLTDLGDISAIDVSNTSFSLRLNGTEQSIWNYSFSKLVVTNGSADTTTDVYYTGANYIPDSIVNELTGLTGFAKYSGYYGNNDVCFFLVPIYDESTDELTGYNVKAISKEDQNSADIYLRTEHDILSIGSNNTYNIESLVVGQKSSAGNSGIVIGHNSTTSAASNVIIIGSNVNCSGGSVDSIAITRNLDGNYRAYSVTIGMNAYTGSSGGTAVGTNANANSNAVSMGYQANGAYQAVAIGAGTNIMSQGVGIGVNANTCNSSEAIAIGFRANVQNNSSGAIVIGGGYSNSYIGENATGSIAIGQRVSVSNDSANSVAIGMGTYMGSWTQGAAYSIGICVDNSVVYSDRTVAIGSGLNVNSSHAIVIGSYNEIVDTNSPHKFVLADGTDNDNRHNFFVIDSNGHITVDIDETVEYADNELVTKKYVDEHSSSSIKYTYYSDGTLDENGYIYPTPCKVGKVYYEGTYTGSNTNDYTSYEWRKMCEGFNVRTFAVASNTWDTISNYSSADWYNDCVDDIAISGSNATYLSVVNLGAGTDWDCYIQTAFTERVINVLDGNVEVVTDGSNNKTVATSISDNTLVENHKYRIVIKKFIDNEYVPYKSDVIKCVASLPGTAYTYTIGGSDYGYIISDDNENGVMDITVYADFDTEATTYSFSISEIKTDNQIVCAGFGVECIGHYGSVVIFGSESEPDDIVYVDVIGDYVLDGYATLLEDYNKGITYVDSNNTIMTDEMITNYRENGGVLPFAPNISVPPAV